MEAEILEIGCDRQLLIDNQVVEDVWQAPRQIHHPRKHPDNPLVVGDQPWEAGRVSLYGSVAPRPEGGYRMWYNTFGRTLRTDPNTSSHTYRVCYAESEDGIDWHKPSVGLWDWRGSLENNLVLCENMVTEDGQPMTNHSGTQSFCLLADPGPAADDGLLHAITKAVPPDAPEGPPGGFSLRVKGGICHMVSEDGLRWRPHPERYLLIAGHSDTPNNIHWNPGLGQYMCFVRPNNYAGPVKRRSAVSLSPDLVHWTQSRIVGFGDELDPTDQIYGMGVFPYEGMWLGLLHLYKTPEGFVELQLAHSRDGLHWERLPMRQPILPRGEEGTWDAMGHYTACRPIAVDDELRLYFCGMDTRHSAQAGHLSIGLASWRLDGFVSRRALAEGEVLTRPFRCAGERLYVNCGARPEGALRAEVLAVDTESEDQLNSTRVAEGYGRDDCVPFGDDDSVDAEIRWKEGRNLAPLKGRVIRLRFCLSYADLYSFQLRG